MKRSPSYIQCVEESIKREEYISMEEFLDCSSILQILPTPPKELGSVFQIRSKFFGIFGHLLALFI